jgi:drug/metabolite transporter (DMT)-like permease
VSPRAQSRLAFLALIGGATGIGFAPVLVRLTDTGPSATAFYRVLFALPLLWLWAAVDHRNHPSMPQPRSWRDFACLAGSGLLFAADLSIWHWSLRFTTVANSTLLTNIAPLFVSFGAWLLLKEAITRRFLLGMTLSIAGGCLLAGSSAQLTKDHLWGDFLAVVAAVFYGGYLLMVKHLRTRFATPTIMAWSGLVSCPAFGLIGWVTGDSFWASHAQGWMAIGALALVSHVGGQTLIAYGFGHLPASFSAVSLLWQPVVAAGVAWIILHEPLRGSQALGGLVVLGGIALAGGLGRSAPDGPVPAGSQNSVQCGAKPTRL